MRHYIYCSEVPETECCSSCHSDWENEDDQPFEDEITPKLVFSHCCAASITRSQAAKVLCKRRKPVEQPRSDEENG